MPRNVASEATSGAVRVALEIARAQAKLGHEAWVAAVDREAGEAEWEGVRLVWLKLAPWARARIAGKTLDFRVQFPLAAFTHQYRFDILQGYVHYYLRFLRAPIRVAFFQTDPFHRGFGRDNYAMETADFAVTARTSDVQLAASTFVARQLQRGFAGGGNVHVVYNGVDSEHFDATRWSEQRRQLRQTWGVSAGAVVFLYAGAIVPEKGVLPLARAFARLSSEFQDVHLVVAGAAALWDQSLADHNPVRSYEEEVRAALAALARGGQVHFLGNVGLPAMPGVYAASDAVVVPSVWQDPFPLVALEALASSRPVIASDTGGLPESVNEANGLLVPPGDEQALMAAMHTLACDAELRRRLGLAGRAQALSFSWERAARTLDAIYVAGLAGGRGG